MQLLIEFVNANKMGFEGPESSLTVSKLNKK